MKKKLIALAAILILSLTACGAKQRVIIDESGIERPLYGRFVEISREKIGVSAIQSILYDKDTKIMYILTKTDYSESLCPFYVMNENNEPVIGIYYDPEEE